MKEGEHVTEYTAPTSKAYIYASIGASALFTVSCIVRGIESGDVLVAKGVLAIASFSTGLAYILYTVIRRCVDPENRKPLPFWQLEIPSRKDTSVDGYQNAEDAHDAREPRYVFKWKLLAILMIRGALEFAGSLLYVFSLNVALENGVNQGISSSFITLAGVFITVMSYFAYGEKISLPQFVGIVSVLLAVTAMGFA